MTTTQQQAIFPDLPRDIPIVRDDGYITPEWFLYFDQLTIALQTNFKPEGIVIPPKTTSEITDLADAEGSISNIVYDSTLNVWKGIKFVSRTGRVVVTQTVVFTTVP